MEIWTQVNTRTAVQQSAETWSPFVILVQLQSTFLTII